MLKRILKFELPRKQSAFLWGARQTGKSTYLEQHFPESIYIDLLLSDLFISYSKNPSLLRERVLALSKEQLNHPIIIDEIQKIPEMLDEVHWLIEHTDAQFILCGSSARKLKRHEVNLLGGRAWKYQFYPLVWPEIPDFDLGHALNTGLIPSHYLSPQPEKSLQAYIEDYLTHEIKEEGLVRSLPHFARFLDSMAFSNGEMLKYSNIAQDCGVDAKTVQNYFQILVDTMLGYYLPPFKKRVNRSIIIETPKFYLFDVGVANYLANKNINVLKGSDAGKAFEHFIFMELIAYKHLKEKRFELKYWRTNGGLEVDFIIGDAKIAIEVKIKPHVLQSDIKGLIAFCKEHNPSKAIVISQDPRARRLEIEKDINIHIIPWQEFLNMLWNGDLL